MQMELNNKSREKALDQIAHMQSFVDRFKAKATKAKQAQARMKMIEKLRPPEALFDEDALPFIFQQPEKGAWRRPMIDFRRCLGRLWRQAGPASSITYRIEPDDRIALIGVNGNGKSTFAKLLAGDLKPMGGADAARARSSTIAYFAQHQMDKLKPKWSAVRACRST